MYSYQLVNAFYTFAEMEYIFYKYQGTGNDFVIIDNRQNFFPKNNTKLIAQICDRKFGVGADGLLLLEDHSSADFTMHYYNADGNIGSMCGNGGRCMVHFADYLNMIDGVATFEAIDGMHEATLMNNIISLSMNNVDTVKISGTHSFVDTGSPHHVQMVSKLESMNVISLGRQIRTTMYGESGANINFVEQNEDGSFSVRTYERGVENETLSCGTGVTAVALAMYENGLTNSTKVTLKTLGGNLSVSFMKSESGYESIKLIGPATQVFKGIWR